ncbi:hypothetical protein Tco_0714985 [Tanacetum coccineum]
MSEPVFDIVEDILVRLDGEDLLRCKSIYHNNPELGHRRIIIPRHSSTLDYGKVLHFSEYWSDVWCIVGSCNGLVCFSTSLDNAQVIVSNPLTREGFGYDSLTDDYKVVIGTEIKGKTETLFQVLTLKSNLWKVTKQVNWGTLFHPFRILWKGVLHWFMKDSNSKKWRPCATALLAQRDDSRYVCDLSNYLGITNGCLCIYRNDPPYQRWVMKSYYDKQSWELLRDDYEKNTYDIERKYIRCPIYVQSLVSPHLNGKQKKRRQTKNNKQTDKAINHGGAFTKPPKIRYNGSKVNWINNIDSDAYSVNEVSNMMKNIGYDNVGMEFYFKERKTKLDKGLRKLATDSDVMEMLKFVSMYKVIDFYVDHFVYKEPMNVEHFVCKAIILYDPRNLDKFLDNDADEVLDDLVQAKRNRNVHNLVITEHVANKGNAVSEDESESEYGSNSDDSDFIVDEENLIHDVDVDMQDFNKKYANVGWMGFKESVQEMNEVFHAEEDIDFEDFDSGTDSWNEGGRRQKL